ncbi:MAG: glycosyltransferase family 4 protein [Methanobacterium sp.]|jgi:glycosyltransferase involved in cell wall biosynthesis
MDIGIVSSFIDDFSGGIGVYTHQLLKNLNLIDKENEYYPIHYLEKNIDVYNQNKDIIIPKNRFVTGWGNNMLWRYFTLPLHLKKYSLDVIHDPYELGAFTFGGSFRKIITVHDLTPLLFPSLFKKMDVIFHRLLLKKTINNADKIITVSYHTQKDLITYLNVPKDKIKVIYNGNDARFQPLNYIEISKVREKYKLPERFILSVGGLHPIKNISRLLKAYNLSRRNGLNHKLVIVGMVMDKVSEIFQTLKGLNLEDQVIFTGKVPDNDLVGLYNSADLFIYPCLYAGFGLPPLEAMSCGTPVIASNNSSLPEVVGDAGLLINPYDITEIADAINNIITDDDLRKNLIKKGLKRSKQFNWSKSAYETLEVYKEVYDY